jgi:hypothetical protein
MQARLFASIAITLGALLLAPLSAPAATTWTNWTAATAGAPGSASGTVAGVGVTYSGELDDFRINANSGIWSPNSSFIGGTVTASPSVVNDDLRLNGISFTGTSTITFASAVENPLFAIWSLGAGTVASFTFNATPTLQAGGPNTQFGGGSIVVNGNTVSGAEGNGVVQFTGTFTSISFTSTPEHFYAFTVGVNGPVTSPVPEPTALLLVSSGLALGVGRIARRVRRRRDT